MVCRGRAEPYVQIVASHADVGSWYPLLVDVIGEAREAFFFLLLSSGGVHLD